MPFFFYYNIVLTNIIKNYHKIQTFHVEFSIYQDGMIEIPIVIKHLKPFPSLGFVRSQIFSVILISWYFYFDVPASEFLPNIKNSVFQDGELFNSFLWTKK